MSFECAPCRPRLWRGYYRRIPGDETAFHVDYGGRERPYVYWSIGPDRGRCHAIECRGAYDLARGVNAAKRFLGGYGGGSFLISEKGEVLVPAPDGSGTVAFAGEVSGRLVFEDPFTSDNVLDLADDKDLDPGDPWNRPYVGMWYNLSRHNRLYYRITTDDGEESVPFRNPELVYLLRRVRPSGPVRFIVNPHGIVLTKVQDLSSDWDEWFAVYVGRLGS